MILRACKPLDLIRRFTIASEAASVRHAYSHPSVPELCLSSHRSVFKDHWARARTRSEREPGTRLQLSIHTAVIATSATPPVHSGMQSSDNTQKEGLERTCARVAVAQMTSSGDQTANFSVCGQLAREASQKGCSMLFLPECCSFIGRAQTEVRLWPAIICIPLCAGLPR